MTDITLSTILSSGGVGSTDTIPAGGTVTLTLLPNFGRHRASCVVAEIDQPGTVVVNRFHDNTGVQSQALVPITAALAASTATVVPLNDGAQFESIELQLINSGTVTANVACACVISQVG